MNFSVERVEDGKIKIPADFLDILEGKDLFTLPIKLRGVNTLWICSEHIVELRYILSKKDNMTARERRTLERSIFPSAYPAKIYRDGKLKLPENFSFSAKRLHVYLMKEDSEDFVVVSEGRFPIRATASKV